MRGFAAKRAITADCRTEGIEKTRCKRAITADCRAEGIEKTRCKRAITADGRAEGIEKTRCKRAITTDGVIRVRTSVTGISNFPAPETRLLRKGAKKLGQNSLNG